MQVQREENKIINSFITKKEEEKIYKKNRQDFTDFQTRTEQARQSCRSLIFVVILACPDYSKVTPINQTEDR